MGRREATGRGVMIATREAARQGRILPQWSVHVQADRIAQGDAVHRVGDSRDDAVERAVRRRQPVAGISRLSRSGRGEAGGLRGDPGRHQPVRGDVGRASAARSGRARVHAPLRRARRCRRSGHHLLRIDRGDDEHDDGAHRSGRRGGDLRAVLRELRTGRDPVRRLAALRDAARTSRFDCAPGRFFELAQRRVELRSRRARRRVQSADPRRHHQHAEQPDRQGIHARRARDHCRAVPQVGRRGDLRRNLRAHHLRRPPARADGRHRRHGRADRHDQRALEDV